MKRYPVDFVVWCVAAFFAVFISYRLALLWIERHVSDAAYSWVCVGLIAASLAIAWVFDAQKAKRDSK
jgi:hypothetical protein